MTKSELVEALSEERNISLGTASGVISTIFDTITETLANSENVEIRGFGSFKVKHYGSYTGRNPKTGKEIEVKVKKLPFFKVGKELKEAVNKQRKVK